MVIPVEDVLVFKPCRAVEGSEGSSSVGLNCVCVCVAAGEQQHVCVCVCWKVLFLPHEWASECLCRSAPDWSCPPGSHHSPPAPGSYTGACPCLGLRSGGRGRH